MPIRSFMLLPSRAEEFNSLVDQPVFDLPGVGRQPPPLKELPLQPLPLGYNTLRFRMLRAEGWSGAALDRSGELLSDAAPYPKELKLLLKGG